MPDHWPTIPWLRAIASPSRARSTFRPMLETLENRCVPAGSLTLTGNVLSAVGDPAESNSFQFTERTAIVGANPLTTYTVTFDGQLQTYTNLQVTQILVYGAGSANTGLVIIDDTYMAPGLSIPQQTPYTAVVDAGGGYLLNSSGNIFLQFSQFQTTSVYVGSADTSYVYTIAGSNNSVLVTSGNYGYVTGNGDFYMIVGAPTLYGISVNASDQAYQYDTSGQNYFTASGNAYSSMAGSLNGLAFMNIAVGFPTTFGISTHGGGDIATLFDSPGNDVFDGTMAYSYMSGSANGHAYFTEVQGFSQVTAESFLGGTDFAYNFDTSVNIIAGNWHVLHSSAQ